MTTGSTIFGCSGTEITRAEQDFFADANPFGFILFTRNVETPAQVHALCDGLRESVGRNAPILIDQEGGRVQRMTPPHWHQWVPPLDQVNGVPPQLVERCMYLRFRLIAAELRASGVDTDCAPMGDVATPSTHPFLRNRCYSEDPEIALRASRGVAAGLSAGGVLPVVKHIPGHGRSTLDSHKELPRVSAPRAELENTDFAVFRGLADLPMAMTAHIVYEDIDPENPATQSSIMTSLIREDIGFDGLLMTDDMSMEALSGTPGERAAASLSAGCDIALHCNGKMEEMIDVARSSGTLSGQGKRRADAALQSRTQPDDADLEELMREFQAMTQQAGVG